MIFVFRHHLYLSGDCLIQHFSFLCWIVCCRSVSYAQCCLCFWIVHSWFPILFFLMFFSTTVHNISVIQKCIWGNSNSWKPEYMYLELKHKLVGHCPIWYHKCVTTAPRHNKEWHLQALVVVEGTEYTGRVSEWFLFNAKGPNFQLYHGEMVQVDVYLITRCLSNHQMFI